MLWPSLAGWIPRCLASAAHPGSGEKQLVCGFISNHGLLSQGDRTGNEVFRNQMDANTVYVNAVEPLFLSNWRAAANPEKRRLLGRSLSAF